MPSKRRTTRTLRVATIECGAGWASYLLPRLDKAQRSCTKHSPWIGGRVKDRGEVVDLIEAHTQASSVQEVLAFCQARPNDGGSGALIVLLRLPAR